MQTVPAIVFLLSKLMWGLIIGYACLMLLLFIFQERFIFKPEKLHKDFEYKYDVPFKELNFDVSPGVQINGLHFFLEKPHGLILYFHGNSRSIKGWAKYVKDFSKYGYDVVLVDYRGFGKSTGEKSEKEMMGDMQFVYDKLEAEYGEEHLIVYGRSLGSGFATKLASDNSPRFLILDAPFYNFKKAVARFLPILPIRYILRYHMRSDLWIKKVPCHTYIIHGTKDWLLPIRNSENLRALNPKRITLIRIPGGGHNNLPSFNEYHAFIRDILAL